MASTAYGSSWAELPDLPELGRDRTPRLRSCTELQNHRQRDPVIITGCPHRVRRPGVVTPLSADGTPRTRGPRLSSHCNVADRLGAGRPWHSAVDRRSPSKSLEGVQPTGPWTE